MLIQSSAVPDEFLQFRKNLPISDTQTLVFIDIETMGLSRRRDPIILIGLMILGPEGGFLHQYFSQAITDERDILNSMVESIPPGSPLITYNGRAFDIPYLNHRLAFHGLVYRIPSGRGIDLMYWAKKALPEAPRYTLKSIEVCLGIQREDTLSGAECVQQYTAYLRTKDPHLAAEICRHNFEDILHLAPLLRLYTMLPENSPLKELPFYLLIQDRIFWIDRPSFKNGFLMITGSSENPTSQRTVNYIGSASLQILHGNIEATLPVIEFEYPVPGSLYIDSDRIPGFSPSAFNTIPFEDKSRLMVRKESSYLPNALTDSINRLLTLND